MRLPCHRRGFSQNYRIFPFKGPYLYSNEPPSSFRTNISPVPDLRNPFLGVHFVAGRRLGLLTSTKFDYQRLAMEEITKYSKKKMVSLASVLADGVEENNYLKWGRPGIRAQLLDITKRKLEMDLVLEGDHHSMHILNAVSPAFIRPLPFASYVCDHILKDRN